VTESQEEEMRIHMGCCLRIFILFCAVLLTCGAASAIPGKGEFYLLGRFPSGPEAEDHSGDGVGIGFCAVSPSHRVAKLFAVVVGADWAELDSKDRDLDWRDYDARTRQVTTQHYARIYFGGEIGGHGHGFLRPHAGVNFAVIGYWIYTRLQEWNYETSDWETFRPKKLNFRPTLGYDFSLGLEFNFRDKWMIDLGLRTLRSLFVPLQLGTDAVTIYPQYGEVYLGVGFPISE
jgi:hypothetical protein